MLALDWTKDAATRAGKPFLFNAMDQDGKVLLSQLTESTSPYEVEPAMRALKSRGVCPKVVYVDDGCCNIWPKLLAKLWPDVHVRLDGQHAICRLTQTTSSTQHPWHKTFCALLSEAVYNIDSQELQRLGQARARQGLSKHVPNSMRAKYIPRMVRDPAAIIDGINAAIQRFDGSTHDEMGELLTRRTHQSWAALEEHVRNGCLCDPPGIDMNRTTQTCVIGGEEFRCIRTQRGVSCLEGFHTHQKQWLGSFAQHASDTGQMLLSDGALRWNRKRHATLDGNALPMVFASKCLHSANDLHRRLCGENLYHSLPDN